MTTILCAGHETQVPGAQAQGDDLWLPLSDLERASGWTLKPQGACLGDLCVPLPDARRHEFVRQEAFNLAALWRRLRKPAVHDEARDTWYFGEAALARRAALSSLQAPDFRLPDLEGREHSLSDYRGTKVFLASWASW
jgi:hypothetical protein